MSPHYYFFSLKKLELSLLHSKEFCLQALKGVGTKHQIYPFVLNVYYLQCDKGYTNCVQVQFRLLYMTFSILDDHYKMQLKDLNKELLLAFDSGL